MKKRRLKKGIKFILTILLVIIISYISITIYQKYSENNFKIEVPENQEIKRLKELNYKDEEIDFIIKEISKENLNYLIKNKIDHTIAYSIIKETYYIDVNKKDIEVVRNKMDELKLLAKPLQEWLTSNYDPMCCLVVDIEDVVVLRAEMKA